MDSPARTVIACLANSAWGPLPSREQHLMERLSRHVDVVYVNPLLAQSDLTLCSSAPLLEWAGSQSRRVRLVPNGCEPSRYRAVSALAPEAAGRVRLGYFGAIAPHVDVELLAGIARVRPDWTIELVGAVSPGVDVSALDSLPNIERADEVPHDDIPARLASFTACLLPFRENDFAYHSAPIQAFDYLAAGRPIVSTPNGHLEGWTGLASVARGAEEFVAAIERTLKQSSGRLVTARKVHAARNTWEVRIAQVADALGDIGITFEGQVTLADRPEPADREHVDGFVGVPELA